MEFPIKRKSRKTRLRCQYRQSLYFLPRTISLHLHKSLEVITLGFCSWVESGETCRCITRLRSYSLLFYLFILVIWVANLKRTITTQSLFSSIQSHDCVKRQTQWRALGKQEPSFRELITHQNDGGLCSFCNKVSSQQLLSTNDMLNWTGNQDLEWIDPLVQVTESPAYF